LNNHFPSWKHHRAWRGRSLVLRLLGLPLGDEAGEHG